MISMQKQMIWGFGVYEWGDMHQNWKANKGRLRLCSGWASAMSVLATGRELTLSFFDKNKECSLSSIHRLLHLPRLLSHST